MQEHNRLLDSLVVLDEVHVDMRRFNNVYMYF